MRCWERSWAGPLRSGSSTPAWSARMRSAPTKSVFSISWTKVNRSPPRWQLKQYHDCFCSLTWKLGVFSWWNGQTPQCSRPRFWSRTCCWTTSTRFSRDRIWSRASSDGSGRMIERSITKRAVRAPENPRLRGGEDSSRRVPPPQPSPATGEGRLVLLRGGAVGHHRLGGGQAGHRDAVGAAGHVVQAEFVARVDRVRVAAVLAANADLEVRPGGAALADRPVHQTAHALAVDGLERVDLEDLLLQVPDDELALGVVPRVAERGLGQVVRAEGEELGVLRDVPRDQRGSRDLDHRAELVVQVDALLALHRLGDGHQLGLHGLQLGQRADQRDHDLRPGVHALVLQVAGRLDDGPDLHPGDLGVEDREADAAQAQHRVGLAQLLDPRLELLQ